MPTSLIRPSFQAPKLEELLLDEEGRPVFTRISHGLQYDNQLTMFEILRRSNIKINGSEIPLVERIPKGPIMDAGCGDGLFEALAPYVDVEIFGGRKVIYGMDLSGKKISTARKVARLVREADKDEKLAPPTFYIGDPQPLEDMDTKVMRINGNEESLPKMSIVWCNSMFHWLRGPEKKYVALQKFNDILKNGGVLALNMSAGGTARDFLQAWSSVISSLGPYNRIDNPLGFHAAQFHPDPIGSRPLHEICNMVEEMGFELVTGATLREMQSYPDPLDYSRAVLIYGADSFLAPVKPHYGRVASDNLWGKIEEAFLHILKTKGWKEGESFIYWQENNYIIARKRTPSGPSIIEIPGSITDYLNPNYVKGKYGRMSDRRHLEISLEGDDLEGQTTLVDMRKLLAGVLGSSRSNWDNADQDPKAHIEYTLGENSLQLSVSVRTNDAIPVQKLFKPNFLGRLEHIGVQMTESDGNIAGLGYHSYNFRIPLA